MCNMDKHQNSPIGNKKENDWEDELLKIALKNHTTNDKFRQ